jgi:predicted nucleic acid-binding protein
VIWLEEPSGLENFWAAHANLDQTSPKRWMDAYLGAFAKGHGIKMTTFDKAFVNFEGLDVELLQV